MALCQPAPHSMTLAEPAWRGANGTTDQSRRSLFYGYALRWLRTGENLFLAVPIEKVRGMSRRVQELLGYKSLGGIGVCMWETR